MTKSASTKPYSDQGEVERMAYGYELMFRTICNIAGTSGASESWYRRQANEMLGRLSPLHSLTADSNQHKPGDCLSQYKKFSPSKAVEPAPEQGTAAIGAEAGIYAAELREIAGMLAQQPDGPVRWKQYRLAAIADYLSSLSQPVAAPQAEDADANCDRCQGNGEIVTDWERYLHAHDGDVGDEAVTDCPDCDGTGHVELPTPPQPEGGTVEDVKREIMERTRNMMGLLADLRSTVDLDDESSEGVLGYCDDLETAVHNIGAVASHLPDALQPEKTNDQ